MGFIPSWLKTETIIPRYMPENEENASGAPVPVEALVLPSMQVEIRDIRPPNDMPRMSDGVQHNYTEKFIRHDDKITWTHPDTGKVHHDFTVEWLIEWFPSDGGGSRFLRPSTASEYCPITFHWYTECIEVPS